ncbi:MAG: hypothetical protein JWM90_2080 [Thermoleophilia bacterium]|nr:hypothetical protein [Thermoleophilia bacterium]
MSAISSSDDRIRPSAWWYLLCAVLAFGGLILGIRQGFEEAGRIADSYERFDLGSAYEIELRRGDARDLYAIWNDGRSTDSLTRPALAIEIEGPNGSSVTPTLESGSQTFSDGAHSAIRVAGFEAPSDGTYAITVLPEETTDVPDTMGIGSLDLLDALGRVLGTIALGFGLAIALVIALAITRGRAKKRRRKALSSSYLGVPNLGPPAPPQPPSSGPITFE